MEDLDSLLALAARAGVGLTTLPASADVLRANLGESQRAFEADVVRPRGERYVLVMEDLYGSGGRLRQSRWSGGWLRSVLLVCHSKYGESE